MDEKEVKVLKYIKERVSGNNSYKYETSVSDDLMFKEIDFYIDKLFDRGYVVAKSSNWAIRGGRSDNQFRSNLVAIIYDHLKISLMGEAIIKELDL